MANKGTVKTEEKQAKKYKKSVILKSKDQYVQEHYLVFKVVLKDDELYTLEEAKATVKAWLESEDKTACH